MAIPEALLSEIRGLRRKPSEWFSIEDIKKNDRDLEIAGRYIAKRTNKELVIPREKKEIYEKLEDWAARLLEKEVRLYEYRLWQLCSENSAIPSIQDDKVLVETASEYMTSSVEELKEMISNFCGYKPDEFFGGRSRLNVTSTKLNAEMSVTIPLAAEIARLEMLDTGHGALHRLGHAQIRMERFFSKTYATIPHPFRDENLLTLSPRDLKQAIRLITYVVFKKVDELRLAGFEEKFVNVFLGYLSCSRESSAPVIEQITALFEPFLKKLCFVFDRKDPNGKPLWPFSLDGLIAGLNLSQADLKKTDKTYWQGRSVQDGTLRLAYQLRHMSAHEAHEYPYYENERHAYFIFAAIVLSCATVLQASPDIRKVVELFNNLNWGIHLTKLPPTCSVLRYARVSQKP
ncbi:hypothetical protein MYX84_11095 [Acidobacteria bacterium AH-259-O06]|nr:hypothetical protein [Acidobacteria bacterium AH-259-O06]